MAASVEPADFTRLQTDARRFGATPVVVQLASLSLDAVREGGEPLRGRLQAQADRLVAELGNQAWAAGRWSNGMGQMELYLTERGLRLLSGSGNALSFWPGKRWFERTAMDGADGRFEAIEQELNRAGHVDVEAAPNVEGLEFDLRRDGGAEVDSAARQAMTNRAAELLASLGDTQLLDRAQAMARLAQGSASGAAPLKVRLTREGVVRLATAGLVRTLKPVGYSDPRSRRFDADVLEAAERDGSAEVIVTLRNPMFGGPLSRTSFDAQTRAHARALKDVLAQVQVDVSNLTDLSMFGAVSGRLSLAQLRALFHSPDARLLSVELNRPVATTALATSTPTLNMAAAWNKGITAAGQSIVVMDSGIQASHAFFRNAGGTTRVTYEACFGSNASINGVNYQSLCPGPNADGDSPAGQAGSAAPVSGCSSIRPNACDHGNHVAGIAAGRNGAAVPAGLQGPAPDANLVAVQVFSFDAARTQPPQAFLADIVKAMEAVVAATPVTPAPVPFTVNLSLGGSLYGAPCGSHSTAFTNAVAALKNFQIPVVAATGNGHPQTGIGYNGSIAWPACAPGVVQVGSVNNDGVGNTRSSFSNLARPSDFPSAYMWLVPGGGGSTTVQSARISTPNTTVFGGMSGTSQAAPHVTGIYAAIKSANSAQPNGISVDAMSEWIRGSASVGVPVSLCSGGPCPPSDTVTFRRIRLPNF